MGREKDLKLKAFGNLEIENAKIDIIKGYITDLDVKDSNVSFRLKGCFDTYCFCGDILLEMFVDTKDSSSYGFSCDNYDGSCIDEFCLKCVNDTLNNDRSQMAYVGGRVKVLDKFPCKGNGGEIC